MLKKIREALLDVLAGFTLIAIISIALIIFGEGLKMVLKAIQSFFMSGNNIADIISFILVVIVMALMFIALPCSLICLMYFYGKQIRYVIKRHNDKRKMEEIKCQKNKE